VSFICAEAVEHISASRIQRWSNLFIIDGSIFLKDSDFLRNIIGLQGIPDKKRRTPPRVPSFLDL
jgi:hypothetical protein